MINSYISTSTIQKNPKGAFTDKNNPIQIVMNNNEPQGMIISWDIAQNLLENNIFSKIKTLSEWEQKSLEEGLMDIVDENFVTEQEVKNTFNRLG